jgi:O-methyltransferase domain
MFGEEWIWRAYGRMIDAVRTGEPAFPRVHGGATLYEYLKTHEDAASVFHAAMSGFSGVEIDAVLAVYDFSSATAAVDVGGAHGAFLAAVMKKYPRLNGIVFDLEAAAEGASKTLREAGLADRARFVSGDFFHSVPEGGDIYILKSVLHNWNGEAAAVILRNCRAATADSARLLVIERIIPPGNQPSEAKLFDINMMVTAGGQERTEDEYASLLSGAGFNVMRVIPTQAAVSVIEAMSADRA